MAGLDAPTHPQCPQLPNTGGDQDDALNSRVDDRPRIRLLTLVPELRLSLSLELLLFADILESVVQPRDPTREIVDVTFVCVRCIRFRLANDDVEVKADLRLNRIASTVM